MPRWMLLGECWSWTSEHKSMHGTAGGTCEQNRGDPFYKKAVDCARADFNGCKAGLATRRRGPSYVSWDNKRQTLDASLGIMHSDSESVQIVTIRLLRFGQHTGCLESWSTRYHRAVDRRRTQRAGAIRSGARDCQICITHGTESITTN